MKNLVTFLALILCVLAANVGHCQSVLIRFGWTQPDSTATIQVMEGDSLLYEFPGEPLNDGDLSEFRVYMAVGGDITQVAVVPAPPQLDTLVDVVLPVPLDLVTSIAVTAVDTDGREGELSEWSDPISVKPGPPAAADKPRVLEVILDS